MKIQNKDTGEIKEVIIYEKDGFLDNTILNINLNEWKNYE